tara:strand:+ start:6549 stop:7070 length:522 start_codon:yes stop_codon:yes gene_type:complete
MIKLFSKRDVNILQRDFQQIILRGKGDGNFAQVVNKEISLLPPLDNLRSISNDQFVFSKQSFDQWSLICKEKKPEKEISDLINNLNSNEEILATDYSYGQSYFEINGENKIIYLNKLTHFDLRPKKFPVSTMAQTSIARIECSIYHLQDKYLVTCHSSYEDYFKDRLQDAIDL